jgi:3-oxoacyl-[acyl-carrier-protein] synthase-3
MKKYLSAIVVILTTLSCSNAQDNKQFSKEALSKNLITLDNKQINFNDILKKHNYSIDDIDLFVFHQASYFMLDVIRRKCKIPKEKFFVNIENFGNSVSSTIPVALYDAEQKGVLKKGMKVVLAGFGIGYSWGATIIKY